MLLSDYASGFSFFLFFLGGTVLKKLFPHFGGQPPPPMNTPLPEAGQPPLLRNFPIVTNLILVYSSLNGSSLMLLITLLH